MKFKEFQDLKRIAIQLAGVDENYSKLSDYSHKLSEAEKIKKELTEFFSAELNEEDSFDEKDIYEIEETISEDVINEKVDLKTSTNPLALLFRWQATLRAKSNITGLYKKIFKMYQQITTNEIKLEVKRDEVAKISGPEAKVKRKELDSMLEVISLKRQKIDQQKKEKTDKISNPGFFKAGGIFGLNSEAIKNHIAYLNTHEKLQLAEYKVKAAQKILTDKEMSELKDQIKQLRAREAKYSQESVRIEQGVKNSIDNADFSEADLEVKAKVDQINARIEQIEKDMDSLRNQMADEDDKEKKKNFAKDYETLMKDRANLIKERDQLGKKAAKVVMGSASQEKE